MTERLWLDVPFVEKDEAKARGARWDPQERSWFAPRAELLEGDLSRWARRTPTTAAVPDLLPGEDRGFGHGLFVDLVPSSCWFTNVRSCVDSSQWDQLRRMVYRRAGLRCEACGASRRRLEAHERWDYDEGRRTQTLRRLICLCEDCHTTTHYGFAQVRGRAAVARDHLMTVNRWSAQEADRHIADSFATWQERSRHDWHLDLQVLTGAGIRVVEPPQARDRRSVAAERLADRPSAPSAATRPVSGARPTVATAPRHSAAGPAPEPRGRTAAARPSLWERLRRGLTG